MTADQPNLQAILDNCIWKQSEDNVTIQDYKEAIDAIYAGLLAVIGPDVPRQVCSSCKDAYFLNTGRKFDEKYADLPCHHSDATNYTKADQRQALKRWCYGENASNE